jgi:hypothetical protein
MEGLVVQVVVAQVHFKVEEQELLDKDLLVEEKEVTLLIMALAEAEAQVVLVETAVSTLEEEVEQQQMLTLLGQMQHLQV